MAAQRVVGHKTLFETRRGVDDGDRNLHFLGDFRRRRVVAGSVGDHQAGAVAGQFAQRRANVAVAEALGDDDLDAGRFGRGLGRIDALLVPAVIGAFFRSQDGDGLHLGGIGAAQDEGAEQHGADTAFKMFQHRSLSIVLN